MEISTYEDIAAKAEWEGGLDEALDWFQDNQVPADLQTLWRSGRSLRDDLENVLERIAEVMRTHGVDI